MRHSELVQNYKVKQGTVQQYVSPISGSAQPPVVQQVRSW